MKSDDAAAPYDDQPEADSAGMDWQELYHGVRERLWILILCLVLALIGAAIYMNGQKRTFQARSVLFIEQEKSNVLDPTKLQDVRSDAIQSLDMINTVVDLLHSYPFAERVAGRLKLQDDPRFLAALPEKPALKLTVDEAAGVLHGCVAVSYRVHTRLIDIFVTLPDPALATEVANTYADEYIRYGFDRKADANKAARQYLVEEAEHLNQQLRASEEAMQSFRERNGAFSLEQSVESAQGKLTELSRNASDIQKKLVELDNDLKSADAHPHDANALLALPSVATQPKVQEINQQIADLDRQFTLLKQRYRAKHPAYIATQTQLASLTRDRDRVLQDVIGVLRETRQQLQAQLDDLSRMRNDQQGSLLSTTGKTVEYNDLKRTLDTNKVLYDSVSGRLAQIDVTKDLTDSPVRVHEKATGAAPVQVSPLKVYFLGALLGIAAGLGVALGLHFLDRSIKTIDQAERMAGVPVLTAVPRRTRRDGLSAPLDMVVDREGVVAESFRTLRTSLAMSAHAEDRRVFMFTSAMPAEGKTFCSSNFSVTLAQQGYKTLLIDCDLRRPTVSRVFFGEHRKPGMVDILAGQSTLRDTVQDTEVVDLKVVTAGNRSMNPAELLTAARLVDTIKEALQTYDRVVIDTAPVLAVSDALLIAPHVDVTCLVLRSFKTPRKTFVRAVKALNDIDCRPVGVVFNFMPTGFGSYYYYSGKYHGDYGTKGVYGT